jgi:hypothetical protein
MPYGNIKHQSEPSEAETLEVLPKLPYDIDILIAQFRPVMVFSHHSTVFIYR